MPRPSRDLAYKDRFLSHLTEIVNESVDTDALASFPDQTTQTVLITQWSQSEYTEILSALEVGAALAFPEIRQQIYYNFLRVTNAMIVDCDDVADCIETSEAVATAIIQRLTENGYVPSDSSSSQPTPVQLTSAQETANILDGVTDCSDHSINMAIARAIVRELHETVQDVFENLELATNANEAAGIVLGAVPVAGTGAKVIELVDWMQQTVVETYQAAYNQSSEDEIACTIYCNLESDCEISLDSLLTIYEDLGSITVPAIETIDDLIEFIVTTTMGIDVTGVAIFHYFLLSALRFGGVVFELAGFNDLVYVIKNASNFHDYSYEQCDDCPTTDPTKVYWRLFYDFALSDWNWQPNSPPPLNNVYIAGSGWVGGTDTTARVIIDLDDIGANFPVVAIWQKALLRNPEASGANDFTTQEVFQNANQGGTVQSMGNTTFGVTSNNAAIFGGNLVPPATFSARSARIGIRVAGGAQNLPTRGLKTYQAVIVGKADGLGNKPDGSAWWRDTLPATGAEYFDA